MAFVGDGLSKSPGRHNMAHLSDDLTILIYLRHVVLRPIKTPQALLVAELLEIIFSFMARDSLAKMILVSRLWTSVALRLIWKSIPSLKELLDVGLEFEGVKKADGKPVSELVLLCSRTRLRTGIILFLDLQASRHPYRLWLEANEKVFMDGARRCSL